MKYIRWSVGIVLLSEPSVARRRPVPASQVCLSATDPCGLNLFMIFALVLCHLIRLLLAVRVDFCGCIASLRNKFVTFVVCFGTADTRGSEGLFGYNMPRHFGGIMLKHTKINIRTTQHINLYIFVLLQMSHI